MVIHCRFVVPLLCLLLPLSLLSASASAANDRQAPLNVALLLETPLGDHDWNDALAAGLQRAERELHVHARVVVAPQEQDMANLENIFREVARDNDLVLVASDRFHEILRDNAANFRHTMFGCIDAGIRAPNIMCITFADEQAAYLAGAAAAMLARQKSLPGLHGQKILGWLSGENIPTMRSLLNGFTEGARIIDPEMRVIHSIVGSFGDAEAGRREARKLLDQGADVLVLACGMGNAPALEEVKAHNAYAIGLNTNHDSQLPGRVLTSILKYPDTAVYDLVAAAATGTFKGKEILVRNLDNGGVNITDMQPFKAATNASLSQDMDRRLNELRREILHGGVRLKSLRARTLCDCL